MFVHVNVFVYMSFSAVIFDFPVHDFKAVALSLSYVLVGVHIELVFG